MLFVNPRSDKPVETGTEAVNLRIRPGLAKRRVRFVLAACVVSTLASGAVAAASNDEVAPADKGHVLSASALGRASVPASTQARRQLTESSEWRPLMIVIRSRHDETPAWATARAELALHFRVVSVSARPDMSRWLRGLIDGLGAEPAHLVTVGEAAGTAALLAAVDMPHRVRSFQAFDGQVPIGTLRHCAEIRHSAVPLRFTAAGAADGSRKATVASYRICLPPGATSFVEEVDSGWAEDEPLVFAAAVCGFAKAIDALLKSS